MFDQAHVYRFLIKSPPFMFSTSMFLFSRELIKEWNTLFHNLRIIAQLKETLCMRGQHWTK